MRRLTAGVLTVSLLTTGVAPVLSQEPSPVPVGYGGRVALPEAGFTMSFPEDWVWVRYSTEEVDAVAGMIEDLTGSTPGDGFETLYEWLDERTPLLGIPIMDDGTADHACFAGPVKKYGGTLDEWVADAVRELEAWSEVQGDIVLTDVALSAGRSTRIDYEYAGVGRVSTYWLGPGPTFYVVACQAGDTPPADRWLSIAETFEFLPEEEPAPVGMGGRVEVLEEGYAVAFPADWAWVRQSDLDVDTLASLFANITDATYVDERRGRLTLPEHPAISVTAMRYPPGDAGEESCNTGGEPMPFPLDDFVALVVDDMESRGHIEPGSAILTEMALPAGATIRVDSQVTLEGWSTPYDGTSYYLVNDDYYYAINCGGDRPPEDRWLSIADTFEFLPAVE